MKTIKEEVTRELRNEVNIIGEKVINKTIDLTLAEVKKVIDETDYMGYVKEINHFSNEDLNKQIRKDLKLRLGVKK